MPTYEYVCDKCGHVFEKFQSMSDQPLKVCPRELCGQKKWGKGKVVRAIGAGAGLIFKGSGFYITDYRSENYKNGAKQDSGKSAASPTSSTTSSDTKPAKSADPKPAAPATPAPKPKPKKGSK
jgi:putative FmdB family regulatory protein